MENTNATVDRERMLGYLKTLLSHSKFLTQRIEMGIDHLKGEKGMNDYKAPVDAEKELKFGMDITRSPDDQPL